MYNEPSFHRVGGINPSAALPIKYTALTALGLKPSLRGEKPVTKGLSYGKAIFLSLPDSQCASVLLMNFDVYVRETMSLIEYTHRS